MISDESGDLGSAGTKYFINCAIVSPSYNILRPVTKLVKNKFFEKKYHNSSEQEKICVLKSLSELPIKIIYVYTEKNNPDDHVYMYGKELYKRTLFDLLSLSIGEITESVVNVVIDETTYITQKELRLSTENICKTHSKILKVCRKGISQNEPCIRIADFVAGSIGTKYEKNDNHYFDIVKEKVVVARKY